MKCETEIRTCILIEDNEDHAYLISKVLAKTDGLSLVASFSSASLAVDYLSQATELPNFILLDVNLPDMTGFDFLHFLRSNSRLQSTPVAMLTSSDAERDRVQARSYDVIRYLTKPLYAEELLELLDDVGHYWTNLKGMA